MRFQQRGLAVELRLIGGDALARQLDLLAEAGKCALEVVEFAPDAGTLAWPPRPPGDRHGIDREQLVAGRQLLTLDHGDADNLARYLRGDQTLGTTAHCRWTRSGHHQ